MNKHYWNEVWKDIAFENIEEKPHYAVSNYGRLKSFQTDPDNGSLLKGSVIQGYKALNIRFKSKKTWSKYVHKLVAEAFVKKQNPEQEPKRSSMFLKTGVFKNRRQRQGAYSFRMIPIV